MYSSYPFTRIGLESVQLEAVLEQAETALTPQHEPEASRILEWMSRGIDVGYQTEDTRFQGQARVTRPGEDQDHLTAIFVRDRDPVTTPYPELRDYPMYNRRSHTIFAPHEVTAHPAVFGAVMLHEAVHAWDAQHPDPALAQAAFPGTDIDNALRYATEVKAFEYEGHLLRGMLGRDFSDYLDSEIALAHSQAMAQLDEQGGLLIEAGTDASKIIDFLQQTSSFTSETALNFAMSILRTALPTYVGLETINSIAANEPDFAVGPNELLAIKAGTLSDMYHL